MPSRWLPGFRTDDRKAIRMVSPCGRHRGRAGRTPLAGRDRALERLRPERCPAARHRVGRRPARRLRVDDVRPHRRGGLPARGTGDEPVPRVGLLEFRGGATGIFFSGRRCRDQPALSAVGSPSGLPARDTMSRLNARSSSRMTTAAVLIRRAVVRWPALRTSRRPPASFVRWCGGRGRSHGPDTSGSLQARAHARMRADIARFSASSGS